MAEQRKKDVALDIVADLEWPVAEKEPIKKKPSILKLYGNEYFGKHGFVRPPKMVAKIKAVNLSDIEKNLDSYTNKNLIIKEKDVYVLDLKKIGYDKLLGSGNINNKYKVVGKVSKKARLKIEEAGGLIEEN